jgi:hypothetical protein
MHLDGKQKRPPPRYFLFTVCVWSVGMGMQ